MTLGIIDVGTNTIHLLIGVLGLNGKFHVILKERDLTRLGEGGLVRNRLAGASMRRALEVLRRYADVMRRCGVDHIEAVATSAVREAANGRDFVRRVRRQTAIPLRIVSGREEARLIYLGVLQVHQFRRSTLIISIGGGSTQVMVGDANRAHYLVSVQLGGARLNQRFIRHDPPLAEEVADLYGYVRRVWAPVVRALRGHRWQQVFGSSATIYQLSMAAYLQTHRRPPQGKMPLWLSQQALRRLTARLERTTAAQRIQMPGVDPRRQDMVLPTGAALLTLMESCGVSRLRYAPGSLREGLVLDYLRRHHERQPRRFDEPATDLLLNQVGNDLALPWRKQLLKQLRKTNGAHP